MSPLECAWLLLFYLIIWISFPVFTLSAMCGYINITIACSGSWSGKFSCKTSSLIPWLSFPMGFGMVCRVPWLLKIWNVSRVFSGSRYSWMFVLGIHLLGLNLGIQNLWWTWLMLGENHLHLQWGTQWWIIIYWQNIVSTCFHGWNSIWSSPCLLRLCIWCLAHWKKLNEISPGQWN